MKLGLAECGKLTSKKLPSVALELIALHAFQMEQEEAGRNSSGWERAHAPAVQLAADELGQIGKLPCVSKL